MAIETEAAPEEETVDRERSICNRLISDLESEIERVKGRIDREQQVDRALHGEQGGLYHINESEIQTLENMIKILREGKDRREIEHFLQRKIENERSLGQDTAADEDDLRFLESQDQMPEAA
ncbi:MAG: hypothetical protein WC080_01040 [Patescibacteria group bacterium]